MKVASLIKSREFIALETPLLERAVRLGRLPKTALEKTPLQPA